ncbi:MAG: transposase, partial [Candidatus Pacebacteria bacterium]|nr:transposase [Candidatus Paceibacterota bacterium]
YERARQDGYSEAEAVACAADDNRGGSNRVFTREQSNLLADIVRAATPSMTHALIREEALQLHAAVHTQQHQLRSVASPLGTFHASNQFITRFKRRNNLASHRTAVAYMPKTQPGENREERHLDYVTEVHSAVLQYGARLVLNMDETAISKIDPPTTAVVAKNSGHAALVHTSIGSLGQQITTMPCISAAGDKLQLCVVVKGKTPRCLRRILADASPAIQRVRFYFSPKGWVNEEIMLQWLHDVVQPYTRSAPAALILDSYSSHFTDEVRAAAAAIYLDLIQVPPGATSTLQPLDVQYNSTLLNTRKRIWREEKQRDALAEDSPRAAIERQSIAYHERTRAEGVAAFEKAYLLPAL